jgi:hypothetical protein
VVVPANPQGDSPGPLPIRKGDPAIPVKQGQLPTTPPPTNDPYRTMPTYSKTDLLPDSFGDSCADGSCQPNYPAPPVHEPAMHGRGHFIGEVAASFLVPIFNTRTAYTTIDAAGNATSTDFKHMLDVGAGGYLGYVCHNGWGIRAGYFHINGAISTTASNADPATTIVTPTGPLSIVSPSPTLAAGLGVDQLKFTQRIAADVADLEVVKECHCFDSTFLFSFGGRYARFVQSYTATRTNPGGDNGVVAVAVDRENLDVSNYYQGWGPTVSFDAVHPICCWGLSLYGTGRGSFLWGTDRYGQNYHLVNTTIPAGGAAVFTDTSNSVITSDTRYVSSLELEAGLQYGCRVGCCYLFMRAGATYQRWWDLGNPTTQHGNVGLVGGTARVGISF